MVVDSVTRSFAVKLDDELEIVEFIGQLLLPMSATEIFSTKSADFFVAGEEQPRFNLRGLEDFDESKYAATIIAANTLRTHQDISVSRNANIANGFIMNRVQMSDEQNRSLSANENEIVFADKRIAFEFLAEPLEELLLSRAQEVF